MPVSVSVLVWETSLSFTQGLWVFKVLVWVLVSDSGSMLRVSVWVSVSMFSLGQHLGLCSQIAVLSIALYVNSFGVGFGIYTQSLGLGFSFTVIAQSWPVAGLLCSVFILLSLLSLVLSLGPNAQSLGLRLGLGLGLGLHAEFSFASRSQCSESQCGAHCCPGLGYITYTVCV